MKKANALFLLTSMLIAGSLFISASAQSLLNGDKTDLKPDTLARRISYAIESYVNQTPDVIYPTPTSMALTKFIGYPVSHATGTVDVSLPLYDMKQKHLNIPFKLQYHSSGIRLNDFPGIIGYGWSLSPGFKISRIIMGKPDERYPVNYTSLNTIEDEINIAVPISNDTKRTGEVDGQYDIFSIFLPNVSASFILRYQNNSYTVKMITEQPLKIVPLIDKTGGYMELYGFEVTDEHGVKYYLGEATHYHSNDESAYGFLEVPARNSYSQVAAGWMLRKIVQPNNDEINFSYKANIEVNLRREDYCVITDAGQTIRNEPDAQFDDFMVLTGVFSFDITNYMASQYSNKSTKIPTSIEFKANNIINNKIEFGYKENPLTPTPSTRFILESMKVYANSSLIKTILFTSKSPGLLTAVSISGEGKYQLSYNEQYENQYQSETTKAMDWWGFYNGKTSNATTIPQGNVEIAIPNQGWGWDISTRTIGNANREPDSLKMQAKILNLITYPTGGTFKINYDVHRYQINSAEKYGGGLRVHSTELFDPSSNKTTVSRYVYQEPHYTAPVYPTAADYRKDLTLCGYTWNAHVLGSIRSYVSQRIRTITSISPHSYFSSDELPVWYGKVTVFINEDNKSVYRYSTVADNFELFRVALDLTKEYAHYKLNHFLYRTPILLEEQHYKKEGTTYSPKLFITNSYLIKDSILTGLIALPYKKVKGEAIGNWQFLDELGINHFPLYRFFPNIITTKTYKFAYGSIQLTSSLKQTTEQGKVIAETTTYKYDAARPYNITEKTILNSQNSTLSEKYYYSNNALPGMSSLTSTQKLAIAQLDAANYKTLPLQQTLEKDSQLLFGRLSGFRSLSTSLLVPETTYEWRSNAYAAELQYSNYDSSGNLRYVTKDAQKIIYLWGYNRQYPIVEIKGCTYENVTNAISENIINSIALRTEPTEADWNTLRSLQGNSYLNGAHVTLFKYKPSVGISETIEPNGLVTRYAYDSTGRLIEVSYLEGTTPKVLNSYIYNYKNN